MRFGIHKQRIIFPRRTLIPSPFGGNCQTRLHELGRRHVELPQVLHQTALAPFFVARTKIRVGCVAHAQRLDDGRLQEALLQVESGAPSGGTRQLLGIKGGGRGVGLEDPITSSL